MDGPSRPRRRNVVLRNAVGSTHPTALPVIFSRAFISLSQTRPPRDRGPFDVSSTPESFFTVPENYFGRTSPGATPTVLQDEPAGANVQPPYVACNSTADSWCSAWLGPRWCRVSFAGKSDSERDVRDDRPKRVRSPHPPAHPLLSFVQGACGTEPTGGGQRRSTGKRTGQVRPIGTRNVLKSAGRNRAPERRTAALERDPAAATVNQVSDTCLRGPTVLTCTCTPGLVDIKNRVISMSRRNKGSPWPRGSPLRFFVQWTFGEKINKNRTVFFVSRGTILTGVRRGSR